MNIARIADLINASLAGEMLTVKEITPYIDSVIDEINTLMNSTFPVASELPVGIVDYNYFPDRYIRSVVVPGAAWKFYVTDEEGAQTAMQYKDNYEQGKFYMLRDYSYCVPVEYQASIQQGTLKAVPDNLACSDFGISAEQGL